MEYHRPSVCDSVSSTSSGFGSMLGTPTADYDMWEQLQEMRVRLDAMEQGQGHQSNKQSTPNTTRLPGRLRLDSASSTGSTVIDSASELHSGQIDLGLGGQRLFHTQFDDNKMVLENALTLTSENVDVMSKYHNVVIKFAIVGERAKSEQECSCTKHNCKSCQSVDKSRYEELERQLEVLKKENQALKRRSWSSNKLSEDEEEENSILEVAKETSRAEVQEVVTSEEEEQKKYIIKSVLDPQTNQHISLDEAILQGIVDLQKGLYINNDTGQSMLIPEAMQQNMIDVMYKITNRSPRKRSSYGVVTIQRSVLPKGTLVIKSVKDTSTRETISAETAVKRKILNKSMTQLTDWENGRHYDIMEAVDMGLVELEDTGSVSRSPQYSRHVYKVSGVIDKKTGNTLSFRDAVLRGIVMTDAGMCRDTDSGKFIYVGYAILSGILKVESD